MTDQTRAPARRKTEQAIKIAASWTPKDETAGRMTAAVFGAVSPLFIRGGRMTINAAIFADHGNPAMMTAVAERVAELKAELDATGILHSFASFAGSVPAGTAERLMTQEKLDDVRDYGTNDGEAA